MPEPSSDLRARLATDLRAAMKARDRLRVDVLRTTLAAIANAEAVPSDARPNIDGTAATETDRRVLDGADVAAIVQGELDELAAELVLRRIHNRDGSELETRIQVLTPYLH